MDLSVTYYDAQRDGREAAAAGNGPAEAGRWHMAASETVVIPGGGLTVAAATVEANGRVRRVFYWYDAGGCVTASRLHAKLCTARERLLHHSSVGAFVAVSAEGDGAAVDADLSEFVKRLPPFTGPAVLVDEKG
jgi:EpsI family protein